MGEQFRQYARAYDALYQDKDYEAECDFIESAFRRFASTPVQSILDVGCGTGGHAFFLADRGYQVTGVDRSEEMIAIARSKTENRSSSSFLPSFAVSSIQEMELHQSFDAAICMFAVLSYQTSNDSLFDALLAIRKHLKDGALFVFDFWHGPGVLNDRPTERVKIIENDKERIIRLASPEADWLANTVNVRYRVLRLSKDRLEEETTEEHPMRYFFVPEMAFFLKQSGFNLLKACPTFMLDQDLHPHHWNAAVITQAV